MIRKIEIENFFSIREKQILDFTIGEKATDPDNRFARPALKLPDRVPRVIVFFGANASGKTNVLRTVPFLVEFVRDSVTWSPDSLLFPFQSFRDKTMSGRPIRLSLEFDMGLSENNVERTVFRYDLEVSGDAKHVLLERLRYYPHGKQRRLFERTEGEITVWPDLGLLQNDPVLEKVRPNASVISVLAQFNHPMAMTLYNLIVTLRTNIFGLAKADLPSASATEYYLENDSAFSALKVEIRKLDLGIRDIEIREAAFGRYILFHHSGLDNPLFLESESRGTQRFYSIFPQMWDALQTGSVAVLDELDNDIHPLVLPEFVRQFQDESTNPHNAQLILSCHHATLLEHLEKEEIYFTEKDANGATEVYGLKDIQGVRRDTNIYAKYLAGAFGAVPRVA